jgi:hypothetical protein
MSTKRGDTQNSEKGGEENLVRRNIFVDAKKWNAAKQKAKRKGFSLAHIMRLLMDQWLDDKISITINDEED